MTNNKLEKMLQHGETGILPELPEGYSWVLSADPVDNTIQVSVNIRDKSMTKRVYLGVIEPVFDSIPLVAVQLVEELQTTAEGLFRHAELWRWLASLSPEGESSKAIVDANLKTVDEFETPNNFWHTAQPGDIGRGPKPVMP